MSGDLAQTQVHLPSGHAGSGRGWKEAEPDHRALPLQPAGISLLSWWGLREQLPLPNEKSAGAAVRGSLMSEA